jgi:hypothetical protein
MITHNHVQFDIPLLDFVKEVIATRRQGIKVNILTAIETITEVYDVLYTSFINFREKDLLIKSSKEVIKGNTIRAGTEMGIGYKRYLSHTSALLLLQQ